MLRVEGLKKVFRSGESDLVLFENLSFDVKRGEMLAIVGESGAGKSTLLHILSALYRATRPRIFATGKPASYGSSTICCRNSRRRKTLPCRCCCGGGHGSRSSQKLHVGCVRSDWSNARIIAQANFPAESSSGWLWPARSLPAPNFCWPMSPRETWTDRLRKRFSL